MPRALSREYGDSDPLDGLSGWLIPVGMYLIALAIVSAVNFFTTLSPLLDPVVMENPSDMGTGLMAAIIGNTTGYLLLLACSVWGIVLFFMRHARFPRVMVGVLLLNTVLGLAGVLIMLWVLPGQPFSYDAAVTSVLTAGLGIVYLQKSVRVRKTFRNGRAWGVRKA